MPIYEYQCQECGRRSEELQRVDDPPLTECSQCGGELRKLVSAPAFQFKGSGWYVTDYARKGGGESKGGEEKGAAGGGEGSSKETKGASSTDSSSSTSASQSSSSSGGSAKATSAAD